YALPARYFSPEQLRDREALVQAIERFKSGSPPKALRSRISRQSYPNATDAEIAAANLAVGNPYMLSGYGYGRDSSFYEPVLGLLPGCLVYLGEEYEPFQQRIEVLAEPGVVEAKLRRTPKGLQLSAQVVAGEHIRPLRRHGARSWCPTRSG